MLFHDSEVSIRPLGPLPRSAQAASFEKGRAWPLHADRGQSRPRYLGPALQRLQEGCYLV